MLVREIYLTTLQHSSFDLRPTFSSCAINTYVHSQLIEQQLIVRQGIKKLLDMNQLVYVKNNVVRGFGRGSKELGCPTANVDGIDHLTIQTGIYCGLVQLVIRNKDEIQEVPGYEQDYDTTVQRLPFTSAVKGMVSSFGYNPQYENKKKSLEVHILDTYNFNFYGAELRVLICKKMRDEEKYSSLEELKKAIANDIINAKKEVYNFELLATNRNYFLDTLEYQNHYPN